jgi:reverse gyrase
VTDNVTPITPMHVCASCKGKIRDDNIWEGHTEQCMQPEIRMRRLERMTLEHRMVIDNLSELLRSMSRTLETLAKTQGEIIKALGRLASQVKI